ncbi:MAG: metal-dependent transcriptional regulator [Candidatus Promineifilaceae bacterium]
MCPDLVMVESGSSSQREGLNHQAIEDYLKVIYQLEQEASPVSTSRLSAARAVKPGSATSMIQRLDKLGLVNYTKHGGVTLTPAGQEIALEVIRHHRLVELYLIEALGFGWDEVHEQADILEHVISEQLEERMAAALNHPQYDPHGDPIPSKEGKLAAVDSRPLSAVPAGQHVTVARVPDDSNAEMLRYLAQLGLRPGARLKVVARAPFEGPLTVLVNGEEIVVGRRVAEAIWVSDSDPAPDGAGH